MSADFFPKRQVFAFPHRPFSIVMVGITFSALAWLAEQGVPTRADQLEGRNGPLLVAGFMPPIWMCSKFNLPFKIVVPTLILRSVPY